ncbi:MAG TPA: hypothetical protein VKS60_11800 [Stellaceae bacterium]|nr:hypothetical protein [Stellaceae bacterium]
MLSPFDSLRERLLAAGIAPRHARRYVAELGEHLADLTAEEERAGHGRRDAEARALLRLGTADDLAAAMTARPELRSWSTRAPWAAYLVVPPAVLAIGFAATIGVIMAIVEYHRPAAGMHAVLPGWFGAAAGALTQFDTLVLPVLLGWSVGLAAAVRRVRPSWPVIGMIALALVGAAVQFEVVLPAEPDGTGELSLGFSLLPPFPDLASFAARGTLNLLLTLAPYLAYRRQPAADATTVGI